MSDRDQESRTSEEIAAREAVRSLPGVPPDPVYRERVKQAFVAGRIESPSGLRLVETRPRRPAWFMAGAIAAAAAVTLLVWSLGSGPSSWRIRSASGDGIASIDGRAISLRDMGRVKGVVKPGTRITVPRSGEVRIDHAGMTVLLMEGTDMRVPSAAKNGAARVYRGSLAMGELRITTGPEFHGHRFEIETPETNVEVVGTTLAVIRDVDRTCVCVLEGTVRVRDRNGDMLDVDAGRRRTFLPGQADPESGEMLPEERLMLAKLRDQVNR